MSKQTMVWLVAALVVGSTACAEDGAQAQQDEAYVGCNDLAREYGEACGRCAGPEAAAACRTQLTPVCPSARWLRDADALYAVCLPWLANVSCEVLMDPARALSESCLDQVHY